MHTFDSWWWNVQQGAEFHKKSRLQIGELDGAWGGFTAGVPCQTLNVYLNSQKQRNTQVPSEKKNADIAFRLGGKNETDPLFFGG